MGLYRKILFPILKGTDSEWIHERTLSALALAQHVPPGSTILRQLAGTIPSRPVSAFGLTFPNPLGVAAGFDKNVEVALGLSLLGFGHVEVGTLTPLPQKGNPKPRIHRLTEHRAVINSMGFPNCGVQEALPRLIALGKLERRFVLGVSLGKQKETPLADAILDYISVMRSVYRHADYLAVNISSPNTPDLRQLQTPAYLDQFCARLREENERLAQSEGTPRRPLLIKIAPDLESEDLDAILEAMTRNGIDGVIATNTTLKRDGVAAHPLATQPGGLSGEPLRARSTAVIRSIHERTGGRLPIIGVGGIATAADAREKLEAGATLLQVYTGMIYQGPGIAGEILRRL